MDIHAIPERIAFLILLNLNGQLSPKERRELDKWLELSEEHIELYEEATDIKAF